MSILHSKKGSWYPCDRRLITAMSAGIDRAINPGQPDEIAPGTPVEDFRTAALAVGCAVRRARKLMADEEFQNDLKTARTIAKEQRAEGGKYLASLGREPDDLDSVVLETLDPLAAQAVTKKEFRALVPRNERGFGWKGLNPGYITGAPPPIPRAFGSIAEQDAARETAKRGWPDTIEPPTGPRGTGEMSLNLSDGSTRAAQTYTPTNDYARRAHIIDRFKLPPSDLWEQPEPPAPRWSLTRRKV